MTLAVLRCGRCHEPLDESVGYCADLYGEPVCRECHMLEWAPPEVSEETE